MKIYGESPFSFFFQDLDLTIFRVKAPVPSCSCEEGNGFSEIFLAPQMAQKKRGLGQVHGRDQSYLYQVMAHRDLVFRSTSALICHIRRSRRAIFSVGPLKTMFFDYEYHL